MISALLVSVLLLAGALFVLIGAIGLVSLPDFYTRLHAPTKATTLGVSCMALASVIHFAGRGGSSIHELLILAFLFITAPISAHLMMKTALHLGLQERTQERDVPEEGAPQALKHGR